MYIRDIYQQTSCQQLFQSIEIVMWFIGFLRGGNGKASCPQNRPEDSGKAHLDDIC